MQWAIGGLGLRYWQMYSGLLVRFGTGMELIEARGREHNGRLYREADANGHVTGRGGMGLGHAPWGTWGGNSSIQVRALAGRL